MKRKLIAALSLCTLLLATACATNNGGAQTDASLPICNTDFSNLPCQLPPSPPSCPPGTQDPLNPTCGPVTPQPPLPPVPPHR
jgi:hypothetical protein